jgi:hypothetical protein
MTAYRDTLTTGLARTGTPHGNAALCRQTPPVCGTIFASLSLSLSLY